MDSINIIALSMSHDSRRTASDYNLNHGSKYYLVVLVACEYYFKSKYKLKRK